MRPSRAAIMLAFELVVLAVLAPGSMARAADCAGVSMTIGTVEPPFIGGPALAHARTREQKTGGRANVVTFAFNELYASYARAQNSMRDVTMGGSGIDRYRLSHFDNIAAWTAGGTFTGREARNYLDVQGTSIAHPNVALDMRIPGYFQYAEALELELTKALAGEVTPQQALDTAAKEWNRLTDKLGRKRQLAAYRASMGLPAT